MSAELTVTVHPSTIDGMATIIIPGTCLNILVNLDDLDQWAVEIQDAIDAIREGQNK